MVKPIDELSFEEMKGLRIESGLWYSAIGRGEYELIRQVDSLGLERAVQEFDLYTNEDGIHVDWEKFGGLFYVTKAIRAAFIEFNQGKLFAGDDINAFLVLGAFGGTYDRTLVLKIREEGMELALEKLREDPPWRSEAKRYARHLVDVQRQILLNPKARVPDDYKQPVDAILASYLVEMV